MEARYAESAGRIEAEKHELETRLTREIASLEAKRQADLGRLRESHDETKSRLSQEHGDLFRLRAAYSLFCVRRRLSQSIHV